MTKEIYRALQERLDMYSLGFPATASGVEMKILQKLFHPADVEMFMALTPKLESAERISRRIEKPKEDVTVQLEDMTERGLLFRNKKGGEVRYGAIPFVHGLFEFQVNNLDRELAGLVEQYHLEAFHKTFENSGGMFLRTVPVRESIDTARHVAAYDDAVRLLKEKETIVVADCICRKQKNTIDEGCGKMLEACFMFGSMGEYYIDKGMGRRIDVDEAINILKQAQTEGLVTQPATTQNPAGMCNCCGDCCGVLRALRQSPKPAELVFSNYFAEVEKDLCTGCEVCMDRCQMDAIVMDDDLAEINRDRCIGCGLCITTCPTEAVHLVPKPAKAHMTPPLNTAEQMMTMAQKRGLC